MPHLEVHQLGDGEIYKDIMRVNEAYRVDKQGRRVKEGNICSVLVNGHHCYAVLRGYQHSSEPQIRMDEYTRDRLKLDRNKSYEFVFKEVNPFGQWKWAYGATEVGYRVASQIAFLSFILGAVALTITLLTLNWRNSVLTPLHWVIAHFSRIPGLEWTIDHFDRIIALVALVIATYAILDVRKLFKELASRDKNTEIRIRQELLTHLASYATFSYAAQFIDFTKSQPDKEAAIAMLQTFHTQKLLAPNASGEELEQLRRDTRERISEEAVEYARMIVSCGLGEMKDGWQLPQRKN